MTVLICFRTFVVTLDMMFPINNISNKLGHAFLKKFLTFSRSLSAVLLVATSISSTQTWWRPYCSRPYCSRPYRPSWTCSSLVMCSWSLSIADLNYSFYFFMAFSTSKWSSSLIYDKRSALNLPNFTSFILIISNSLVSISVGLPHLLCGILKQSNGD